MLAQQLVNGIAIGCLYALMALGLTMVYGVLRVLHVAHAAVYALFPRLAERRGRAGRTLSGGEQQMLALGRALTAGPGVLLVDEAALGPAPLFVGRVFEAIRRLVAEGTTLLLVEQNVRQALRTVSRAYLLEVGRIVRSGTAAEPAADPAVRDACLGA